MGRAVAEGDRARFRARPNPWVGAVVVTIDGASFTGATEMPGGRHAERVALDEAGPAARGATMYVTLEPCAHHGRTAPCADAVIEAGIERVVIGLSDPDPRVAGAGMARMRDAGLCVEVGTGAESVSRQLAPYLHHRRHGRPLVVLKLAATLDGRIAAPDGSSRWITGTEARSDVHRLRAESDAVLVGAGTVRSDDPSLTVRDWTPAADVAVPDRGLDPRRIVLGTVPAGARVNPATEASGDLDELLEQLGSEGVLQLLVEGGAAVAGELHRRRLVDRYVVYLAPALLGGDDGASMFSGAGAPSMDDVWRGHLDAVSRFGDDLRIDLIPTDSEERA